MIFFLNLLTFNSFAFPKVESEVKKSGEIGGSSFDNPLSTLEDSVN